MVRRARCGTGSLSLERKSPVAPGLVIAFERAMHAAAPPRATRNHHPSRLGRAAGATRAGRDPARAVIPPGKRDVELEIGGRSVRLTNLDKIFWAELGLTKRDLLQYYADVSAVLLPHLVDRAMVMKRYPNGAAGKCFFMKRAPTPRPEWIETCSIAHASGNIIDFPMVQDPSFPPVAHQPRMHRSESVVCTLRRCRSTRLSALRSRSRSRSRLRNRP